MRNFITLLAFSLPLAASAIEEPFEKGTDLIYTNVNNGGIEKGLSLYKRQNLIFFRHDTAYVLAQSATSDLSDFWTAKELNGIPVDDEFAYDNHSDKIIFSSVGKLYETKWVDNAWTMEKRVKMQGINKSNPNKVTGQFRPENIEKIYHPTFAKGGDRLIFAATVKGRTDLDLWYSDKGDNDVWLAPKRFAFNTDYNEDFPFVVGDSLLYFSSNRSDYRHMHLYYVGTSDEPQEPRLSVLSDDRSDQSAIVVVEDKGYVISDRCRDSWGQICDDNIYKVSVRTHKAATVEAITFREIPESMPKDADQNTMPYIFRTLTEDEVVAAQKRGEAVRPDRLVAVDIPLNDSILRDVVGSAKENITAQSVSKHGKKTAGKLIFYFDLDDDRLDQKYEEDMASIVEYINADKDARYLISGFTDERGKKEHNQDLSVRRAQTVFESLNAKGVPSERIIFTGFGSRGAVVPNAKTEEQHALNRRVEIRRMK